MFHALQQKISQIPENLYLFKIFYSEKNAIKKKKHLFKNIKWTSEQETEFCDLWQQNYGKIIAPWWNMLYESMNGIYKKDYFPEMYYSVKLEPAINPPEYCRILQDKSLLSTIYGAAEGVRFPEMYLKCCNGCYGDGKGKLLTKEEAVTSLGDIGECVIKPTVETGSGKGVSLLDMRNGKDARHGETAEAIIDRYGRNFVVQAKIKNSTGFSSVYPASLNTIRLITYIVENEIHHAPLVMRIGVGGAEVDNIHNGGICIGVNEDGTLKPKAYQLGYGDKTVTFSKHPDTGITFGGYYIGDVQKLIKSAERLHSLTPHVGMISWDLTFDENENVVLIEANCQGQSVWFPQIVNECAIFGDDTPYMIKKMKK